MQKQSRHRLWYAIRGDLVRQYRYQILSIALAITLIYIGIFYLIPGASADLVVQFLIFNDPVALGMLFTGAMYLFEKSENTLEAFAVTPLRAAEYLGSKVITFSALGLAASLAMALAAWGWNFTKWPLILGISLTASLFTMLGFVIVLGTRSFNEYVIKMGIWMIPVALPLLDFFDIYKSYWFYLIPVQPTLLLLKASRTSIHTGDMIYAIIYLLLWNILAFKWALKRLREKEGFY